MESNFADENVVFIINVLDCLDIHWHEILEIFIIFVIFTVNTKYNGTTIFDPFYGGEKHGMFNQ